LKVPFWKELLKRMLSFLSSFEKCSEVRQGLLKGILGVFHLNFCGILLFLEDISGKAKFLGESLSTLEFYLKAIIENE
jgi:hypothetical protein